MSEDEDDLDLSPPPRTKAGVAFLVLALQIVVVLALIRAFAPDFTAKIADKVVSTFTVTVTTPPPQPEPASEIKPAGASGEAGKKAVAREVKAEKPKVSIAKTPAPRAASTGDANTSGATANGAGTGAGGPGNGPGSGNGGNGSGGGRAQKAQKIEGDITSARDYPRETRDLRKGDYVIIAITVSAEGRPTACRVHRHSADAQANAITCQLAMKRFRFRPATDALGNPVSSTYGWKQTWYD